MVYEQTRSERLQEPRVTEPSLYCEGPVLSIELQTDIFVRSKYPDHRTVLKSSSFPFSIRMLWLLSEDSKPD